MRRIKVRRARTITLSLLLGLSLVGLSLMLASPPVSQAASTLTVTSAADAGGSCPGASCTLRQAIATAASGDTITFAPGITTINLTSDELLINKNLTINGPGANLLSVQRSAASGTPDFRIFSIGNFNVTISGLTIANGNVGGNGGGINNRGTMTITNSTISNSSGGGGGIFNANLCTMTITNSTISGNSAVNGGGIFNNEGTVTITNSTISGNSAVNVGGGIFSSLNGTLTITNSTISGNSASNAGGGIYEASGGTVTARNTIIANNTGTIGPDISGTLTSQGFTLIGNTDGSSIFSPAGTTGNQLNVNPMLDTLKDNGGPTKTHALLSGSPAIEGGHSSGSNTDQRGLARPVDSPVITNAMGGDGSDIGAYEAQPDQLPGCNTINRIVNNNDDSGTGSLRAVIANVCGGSTITFGPNVRGSINLTSGGLLIDKSLTVNGPGANLLSVQRSSAADNFRIFNIAGNSNAAISGLTIANGNTPGSNGGGINNNGGTLTVSNSIISGNSAGGGAGGGGIYNNGGTLTVINSTLSGNSASFGGGGINNFRGTITIVNSTISGNTISGGNGGGIYSSGDSTTGTVTVINSTISGNTANDTSLGIGLGGGIHNGGGTLIVINSTISDNTAQFRGGGINSSSATLSVRNTIIALNTSANGPDVFGAVTSQGFNLIGNNAGATFAPAQFSDQIGTPGSPVDPLLHSLQNNGGPTFTHALLAGSTAIDKGHSSGSATDQRGFTRPVGIANVNGGDGSDIGAIEIQLNCSYSINPMSQAFAASGANNSVNVTTAAGCAWSAISNNTEFITINSVNGGTGPGMINYSVTANTGLARTGTITIAGQTFTITQEGVAPPVSNIQFSSGSYSVNEGAGSVTLTVTRTNTSGAATVDYRTVDADTFAFGCADTVNNNGGAYGRCDYATSNDTLSFAAGEVSKSFVVPIIDDGRVEGPETFQVVLSNPSAGFTLVAPAMATVTINDNDTTNTNPILASDNAGIAFFVRQHYLDFLAREPEIGEPWSNVLRQCPDQFNFNPASPSAGCDRITVSGSFFGSPEFLNKGIYTIVFYRVAFNRLPEYTEFAPDVRSVTGTTAAETNAKRAAFANNFVLRPEFAALAAMTNTNYVNTLMGRYGLGSITTPDPANPDGGVKVMLSSAQLLAALNGGTLTRAQVLRAIVQSDQVTGNAEAITSYVASQYYGYLRRKPDTTGFNQWVTHLTNNPSDFRTMINGFVNSQEYRLRFGP